MEIQILDFTLVPLGLCWMLAYHIWLLHRIKTHPTSTIIGLNNINRRLWVRTMMEDTSKNSTLAVQTLRNNMMASTVLASTSITLCSIVVVIMANINARPTAMIIGNQSDLGFRIKCFSILVCFLLAFFFNVRSIRYYSNASMLINLPVRKMMSPDMTAEFVEKIVARGSCFWSLGLRVFYFSFPLFVWLFGPIPMFMCCVVLVFMLYFLDVTNDLGEVVLVANVSHDEEAGNFIKKDEEAGN